MMDVICRECEMILRPDDNFMFMNDNKRFHCLLCEMSCEKCRLFNEYKLFTRYHEYHFELVHENEIVDYRNPKFTLYYGHPSSKNMSLVDIEWFIFSPNYIYELFSEIISLKKEQEVSNIDKFTQDTLLDAIKRETHRFFMDKVHRKQNEMLEEFKKEIIESQKIII